MGGRGGADSVLLQVAHHLYLPSLASQPSWNMCLIAWSRFRRQGLRAWMMEGVVASCWYGLGAALLCSTNQQYCPPYKGPRLPLPCPELFRARSPHQNKTSHSKPQPYIIQPSVVVAISSLPLQWTRLQGLCLLCRTFIPQPFSCHLNQAVVP